MFIQFRLLNRWKWLTQSRNFHGTCKYAYLDHQCEPMSPIKGKYPRHANSAMDAISIVSSKNNIAVQGIAMTPTLLLDAMTNHAKARHLKEIKIFHLHTEGPMPYTEPGCEGIFRTISMFTGANLRSAIQEGRAEYMPIFLSEIPTLFRRKIVPLDVCLVQCSPPDRHGYCSLGTSIDIMRAAVETSSHIIAQMNAFVPYIHGDGIIHISNIDTVFKKDVPLYYMPTKDSTETDEEKKNNPNDKIGNLIASNLVDDGATLQMGIGQIPNAVLSQLGNHKDIGLHTEMFSDGILNLVESGVINNRAKTLHRGHIVSSFIFGSQKLYDFVDDNPLVQLLDCAYVNNPHIIKQQNKMTAINSCIEIDITGQVVSDSIGTKIFSGVGGQVDFLRGAAVCSNGKSILALPSRTKRGIPRIVPFLKEGAGVVTTRAHVHYVVTEFGIAYCWGKTLPETAKELIKVAHPDDREELEKEAVKRYGKSFLMV